MKELFEVVAFPDVQFLMDKEGFRENSHLINDDLGLELYGSSAYFVNTEWLEKTFYEDIENVFKDENLAI